MLQVDCVCTKCTLGKNDLLNFLSQLYFFYFFEARTKELEGLQPYVEELKAQVQSMEGTKGWFERRLKEAEVLWVYSHLSLQSNARDGNCLLLFTSGYISIILTT